MFAGLSESTVSTVRPAARTSARALAIAGMSVGIAAVLLFVYNSGYGYDAVEYLVLGRALNEGYSFYAFVPSKSWAIYYLVAAYFRLPGATTHLGVSILVTAIVLGAAVATFVIVRSRFGTRAAAMASLFVAVGAMFMELNFLETEGFVYLAGLFAFAAVTNRGVEPRARRWFRAGLWIGAGAAFKVVSLLFGAGAIAWLLVVAWRDQPERRSVITRVLALASGVVVSLGVPALYFWATGRLRPFVEWSFIFPLFHYPGNTDWLAKMYTKLLWVWLVVGAAVVVSFTPRMRKRVHIAGPEGLLCAFGVCGLVPLLKTQATHYAFPGAAFLLVFAAVVLERGFEIWRLDLRLASYVTAGGLCACAVSGVMYEPRALERVTSVKSYVSEASEAGAWDAAVPPGRHAIVIGHSMSVYWLANRLPPWPALHTDVQTTYLMDREPDALLAALEDPTLALVAFDPSHPDFDDPLLGASAGAVRFVQRFTCRLEENFQRRDDVVPGRVIWIPAGRDERSERTSCAS